MVCFPRGQQLHHDAVLLRKRTSVQLGWSLTSFPDHIIKRNPHFRKNNGTA